MALLLDLLVSGQTRLNDDTYAKNIYADKFIRTGSSDLYVLLGGGGHKLLSDFSMAHSHPYLPLAGGTMTGSLTVKQYIFGYNYNHAGGDAPSFVFDKPGSHHTGIGANGEADTIYFSAATISNGEASWVKSYKQKWKFNGTIYQDNNAVIHSGNIGSQSVSYASSAENAHTVDGEHASAFAHIGAHNNLTASGNEFTFASSGFSGEIYINYRTAGGTNGNITNYIFGNGKGGELGTAIHSGNYNSYAPTLTGTGASGTWNISISGNAATATNAPWSGITGKPTTFTPSAHTHNASDISGLPTALKNPYAIEIKANGVSLGTYDGSKTVTFNLTANNVGAANRVHSHYSIVTEGDNRTVATTPNDYVNSFIFKGLKNSNTIGSPSSDIYSYLIGLRGWSDNSGGNAHELAFNNSGIFRRQGSTTEWGSWYQLIDTGNFTKSLVEGVLTGNITSHRHSQYLTSALRPAKLFTSESLFPPGYFIITINNNNSKWILSFDVKIVVPDGSYTIRFSEDNSTKSESWYRPSASMIDGEDSVKVKFGYSRTNKWVAIVATDSYAGVSITNVANGYAPIDTYALDELFTIDFFDDWGVLEGDDSGLGYLGTVQETITIYPPSKEGHTHTFASLTSKPTTIAGYGITDALTTSNYNSYAPTLTGTGASGTWGISISGNAATATSAGTAGNADTVDNYHASNLTKFYLSPMSAGAPADSAKSWFINTMPSASGAIVYNVPGSEKTIIAGKSSGAYGHMLQLNYDDNYLRILRYYGGSWKTTDWEKISAGYADSAGSVAWRNITGKPSTFEPSSHSHNYLPLSGGTCTGNIYAPAFYESSDERLKDFYNSIDVDLDKLSSLPKKFFKWKSNPNVEFEIGTSAQELQKIYPQLVNTDDKGYLTVAYDKLSIIALRAIDKLYEMNKNLERRIQILESKH